MRRRRYPYYVNPEVFWSVTGFALLYVILSKNPIEYEPLSERGQKLVLRLVVSLIITVLVFGAFSEPIDGHTPVMLIIAAVIAAWNRKLLFPAAWRNAFLIAVRRREFFQ